MSSVVLCGGLCASPVHRPHGLPQQVAVGGHDARRHDANVAAAGELISVPVLLVVRHRAVVAAARSNNRRVGVIQTPRATSKEHMQTQKRDDVLQCFVAAKLLGILRGDGS